MAKTLEAKNNDDIQLEAKEEVRIMPNEEFRAVMDRLLGDKYN